MARLLAGLAAPGLTLAYAALSLAMLALFATPLLYAWRSSIEQGRGELLKAESQRLLDVFGAKGIAGLVTAVDDQVGTNLVGNKIMFLTDVSLGRVSRNFPEWPAGVSSEPGLYSLSIDATRPKNPANA